MSEPIPWKELRVAEWFSLPKDPDMALHFKCDDRSAMTTSYSMFLVAENEPVIPIDRAAHPKDAP